MIKTIIADNEVWVCQLIKDLVDWEALGFSISGIAYDGLQLMDMITELQPDIIITDIRMPGKSGLEVVQELKLRELDIGVIIVSGYSDFEYAKKAIDLGIFSYLLKPLEKEELTATLLNFREAFAKSRQQKDSFCFLQKKLNKSIASHFNSYMSELMTGAAAPLSLNALNEQFSRSFSAGLFRILLISVDSHINDTHENDARAAIVNHIISFISDVFRPVCHDLFYLEHQPFLLIAVNYPANDDKLIQSLLDDLMYECSHSIPYVSSNSVTIGAGCAVKEPAELAGSYRSALNAIHSRTVAGLRRIIYGEPAAAPVSLSRETKNQISSFVNSYFATTEPSILINEILDTYAKGRPAHYVYDVVQLIYDAAAFAVSGQVLEQYNALYGSRRSLSLDHAKNTGELKQFAAAALSHLREINISVSEKKNGIDIVKSYIDEHLEQDLSLDRLAALIHLNPNYLCELFKKETGENLSKYITYKRIEAAKEYLEDITLKCSEVAAKVGYSDVNYFHRIFKSYLGLTPKQYRKMFVER